MVADQSNIIFWDQKKKAPYQVYYSPIPKTQTGKYCCQNSSSGPTVMIPAK